MSDTPAYRYRNYTDFYDLGEVEGYVDLIVQEVGRNGPAYPGIDLSPHRPLLSQMIIAARMTFLDEDDDARRRAAMEGSLERPHRRLERNWGDEDEAPAHDYSEFQVDDPDTAWEAWWDEIFAKKVSPLTGERARNPGWFRVPGRGGAKLMKPPLVRIYFLVNQFFRRVLEVPFFPIFNANDHVVSDNKAMEHLNPAARLFLLMAQAVDDRYSREHCKRVHDDCYHDLGAEGREISHHRP